MKKKLIALLVLFNSNLIISGDASSTASSDTANPEYKALVDAKNSLDTQYQTLFEAKIAALGKESLGNTSQTATAKSFLENLGSFTAEQKEAIYKYCTTLETVSYLPDGTINPASPLEQLKESLGDKLSKYAKTNLDLFKSFSVAFREAELKKIFLGDKNKTALLQTWKDAEAELKTKQNSLDQATKDYYDPINIDKAQREIAEINRKLDPFVENLETPNLLSAKEKVQEKRLIEDFNTLEAKWQNQGIKDKLSGYLEPLNTKLIEYYALNLSFNPEFRDLNAFFKANQRKILDKVSNFSKIEDLQQIFKERRAAAADATAAKAAAELAKAKNILQINVENLNSGEINQSEFITRVTSLLRDWKEEGILENLKETPEYKAFKLEAKKAEEAKEAQKAQIAQIAAENLRAIFQREQQAKIEAAEKKAAADRAAEKKAAADRAAADRAAADRAAADRAAADKTTVIATELKLKRIAIKLYLTQELTIPEDKTFYETNKKAIDDLIVTLNTIEKQIVAREKPEDEIKEYQEFFPDSVFGDGTKGESFKDVFLVIVKKQALEAKTSEEEDPDSQFKADRETQMQQILQVRAEALEKAQKEASADSSNKAVQKKLEQANKNYQEAAAFAQQEREKVAQKANETKRIAAAERAVAAERALREADRAVRV